MTLTSYLKLFIRRVRSEAGIAVPISLAVLAVVLTLTAVAVAAATQANSHTNLDASRKAALEAAEAGVRTATYRINMFLPQQGYCPTTPATTILASGLCAQDGPESLGNGETFSYWVSDVLANGQGCAGVPVATPNSSQRIIQRCITAVGTAGTGTQNQVSARVQVRVASYTGQSLFSVQGLIGLNQLSLQGHATVNGQGGTNGQLLIDNQASETGTVLGPSATLNPGHNPHADPGTVTQLTPAQGPIGLPLPSFGNTATVNSDSRIGAPGTTTVTCSQSPPPGYDTCSGGQITWSDTAADPRDLTVSNGASLTLGGGIYNFCKFSLQNQSTLKVAAGTYTTIYIDSPADPNSGCKAGQGTVSVANQVNVITQTVDQTGTPDPTALKIFVYGDPSHPGTNIVNWDNNSTTYATIVAPFSTVNLNNSAAFYGAAGGYNTNVANGMSFTWDARESSLLSGQQDIYYRTAWEQCPSSGFSPTAPTAGC
jgi:Tfp pilus assembly protein PilX